MNLLHSIIQTKSLDPQIKGIVIELRNDKAVIKHENNDGEEFYLLHPINDLEPILSIEPYIKSRSLTDFVMIASEELEDNNFDLDFSLHLNFYSDDEFNHYGSHSITFGIKKHNATYCRDIRLDYVDQDLCKSIHVNLLNFLKSLYPKRTITSRVFTHN